MVRNGSGGTKTRHFHELIIGTTTTLRMIKYLDFDLWSFLSVPYTLFNILPILKISRTRDRCCFVILFVFVISAISSNLFNNVSLTFVSPAVVSPAVVSPSDHATTVVCDVFVPLAIDSHVEENLVLSRRSSDTKVNDFAKL